MRTQLLFITDLQDLHLKLFSMVIDPSDIFINGLLFNRGLKTQYGWQSWPLISATKFVRVMLSNVFKDLVLTLTQQDSYFLVRVFMTDDNFNNENFWQIPPTTPPNPPPNPGCFKMSAAKPLIGISIMQLLIAIAAQYLPVNMFFCGL